MITEVDKNFSRSTELSNNEKVKNLVENFEKSYTSAETAESNQNFTRKNSLPRSKKRSTLRKSKANVEPIAVLDSAFKNVCLSLKELFHIHELQKNTSTNKKTKVSNNELEIRHKALREIEQIADQIDLIGKSPNGSNQTKVVKQSTEKLGKALALYIHLHDANKLKPSVELRNNIIAQTSSIAHSMNAIQQFIEQHTKKDL